MQKAAPLLHPKRFPTALFLVFLIISGLIIAGAWYFYYVQKKSMTIYQYQELYAIADLKVSQIENWRSERTLDAETIFNSRVFIDSVDRYLRMPNQELKKNILQQFETMMAYGLKNYVNIYIVAADRKVRLSARNMLAPGTAELSYIETAMRKRKVTFSELYVEHPGVIRLDLIVPLIAGNGKGRIIGAVVLQIDPEQYLYPRIKSWPTPSPSAETLLIRREGKDVVFLNELRHRKETALTLRMPVDAPTLPAALAVRGYQGIVDGMDYRGVPVIAATRPIAGTDWFIVSKIDKDEIIAPILNQALYTGVIAFMMIIAAGAIVAFKWQRERVAHYGQLYASEVQRREEQSAAQAAMKNLMDELTRSNKELEQFAYVASHDLQEPLRMIASFLQLLEQRYKGRIDKDADEFIAYAVDGAVRMQRMVNDLLAYSRIGTRGKTFEPVDVNEILQQAIANLKLKIEETGAKISSGPLPTVEGDPVQLVQVFQNLLANSIKFRGGRIPEIEVKAEARDQEWEFSVRDNGIGIDPGYKEKVFVIFQRLHTASQYPGSGIGLSICKKIVERHHGRIWFTSEPGKGTIFYFTIPRMKNRDGEGSPKHETIAH